ncbi:hypothetical protein Leryth_011038, partial [Lithospermum erythrorhizon]
PEQIYNLVSADDYIHRVGRTARAGRSGVAISLLPLYPTKEEEVLLYLERVSEANRIALMNIKETSRKKKNRRGEDGDGDEEVERYMGSKNGKSSKRSKQRNRAN